MGLHIVPFGDHTILISDARGLYINDLSYFSRLIQGKEDFLSYYNVNLEEITMEWEYFIDLRDNNIEEELNTYYLTDYRKHCHNHEGLALHKCGKAKKGKLNIDFGFEL